MKKYTQRHLAHYHPEILNREELPVNIPHAQFYTMHEQEEDSASQDPFDEPFFGIEVEAFATTTYNVMNTVGKPISKIVR